MDDGKKEKKGEEFSVLALGELTFLVIFKAVGLAIQKDFIDTLETCLKSSDFASSAGVCNMYKYSYQRMWFHAGSRTLWADKSDCTAANRSESLGYGGLIEHGTVNFIKLILKYMQRDKNVSQLFKKGFVTPRTIEICEAAVRYMKHITVCQDYRDWCGYLNDTVEKLSREHRNRCIACGSMSPQQVQSLVHRADYGVCYLKDSEERRQFETAFVCEQHKILLETLSYAKNALEVWDFMCRGEYSFYASSSRLCGKPSYFKLSQRYTCCNRFCGFVIDLKDMDFTSTLMEQNVYPYSIVLNTE